MIPRKVFSALNLRSVILIAIALISIAGCDDNPTSPCHECPSTDWNVRFTRVTDQSFTVENAATVTVNNFVGKVTYRTGEAGIVRVRATRRSARSSHLDLIEMEITSQNGGAPNQDRKSRELQERLGRSRNNSAG